MGKFEPDWLKSAAPSHHPVDIGQRTEAIILAELVKRGLRVLMPFGVNHRYDFAVDVGDRFLRVQCKTGRMDNGTVLFNAQSIRSNTKRVLCRSYAGEIDLSVCTAPRTTRSMLSRSATPRQPPQDFASPRRLMARSGEFVGPPSTNCPPSSTGRALHL